ncbi:uncharacterized protein LOC117173668 [Belonocnema kinseyi]|uniref:uncharacterized protein LOC117173668 n=1 Tax=Belonocnema kinseyi TaxID=2817044 RepID=UPI00143D39BE|nr:uncharacterized protein LOC117173668 [Belonocnema kinseyi]
MLQKHYTHVPIEFLALFDPLLEEHIKKFGNKGSGSTSYLSKTIYEEFVQLLADKLSSIIVEEIVVVSHTITRTMYQEFIQVIHLVNLIEVHAVESTPGAALFFNTVQALYNFFTASTHHWEILQIHAGTKIALKSLSVTRWSASQEAVEVLHKHYDEIIETLIIIEEVIIENAITRQEKVEINIADVIDDYHGQIKVVAATRMEFEVYHNEALEISESQEYQTTVSRRRRPKLQADESRDGEAELSGRDNFRVNTFNAILDNLESELRKRCQPYERIHEKFSVITEFGNLDSNEIRIRSEHLRKIYHSDLESSLDFKLVDFHAYCSQKNFQRNSPSDSLKLLRTNELNTEFPNVAIAFRIFITLAATNCSAER